MNIAIQTHLRHASVVLTSCQWDRTWLSSLMGSQCSQAGGERTRIAHPGLVSQCHGNRILRYNSLSCGGVCSHQNRITCLQRVDRSSLEGIQVERKFMRVRFDLWRRCRISNILFGVGDLMCTRLAIPLQSEASLPQERLTGLQFERRRHTRCVTCTPP